MWRKIKDQKSCFLMESGWHPKDQFGLIYATFAALGITDQVILDFLRERHYDDHPFEFLELCCLTPPIYARLREEEGLKWDEMEAAYGMLYSLPAEDGLPLIL